MAADPTKADRGTTAIIEIEGVKDPLQNVVQFSVSDDYLQVGDTFSAVVPDPTHTLSKKIELYAGYKFYLKNPAIDGGNPSLRQTGVLRAPELTAGMGGDVINLSGADIGWHLQSCAPPFYRLEQATIKDLVNKLITDNPAWGFKGVRDNNDLDRKLRQGRLATQIRLNPSLITPWQVIQIEPGQQAIQVLQEYARRDGLMVNVSADGYIQLSNPNYNQAASFQVNYHQAGTSTATQNNIVGDSSLDQNGDMIYSEVSCIWDVVVPEVGNPPFVANIGRHVATYYRKTNTTQDVRADFGGVIKTDSKSASQNTGPIFPRRYTFVDNEPMTPTQGARRAVWQAQRMEFDAYIYRVRLKGHSQAGKWFSSDTIGNVNDTVRGVVGTLYTPSIRLDSSVTGAQSTYIEMRKTGLLSNEQLRQNVVENKGGVFVEVQSS